MLAKCRELNIPVRLRSCLTNFIDDGNGSIEGVEIREDYIFPKSESGTRKRIRASRAVVLASGGFSQDKEFRAIQNPRLTEDIESTNHQGATAESLISALRAGATPVQLSNIQLGPWASRDEEGFGVGSLFSMLAGFPYGIIIDVSTGNRFVNEQSDRKLLVDSMLNLGTESIAIVDQKGVAYATTLDQCLKRGVVRRYDSIEELAASNHVPLMPLVNTIKSYNSSIEKGRTGSGSGSTRGSSRSNTLPITPSACFRRSTIAWAASGSTPGRRSSGSTPADRSAASTPPGDHGRDPRRQPVGRQRRSGMHPLRADRRRERGSGTAAVRPPAYAGIDASAIYRVYIYTR
jgi:hypothetical protein